MTVEQLRARLGPADALTVSVRAYAGLHPQELPPAATDDSMAVFSVWQYLGSDYLNPGDVLLAAGVEASLRAAREALLDLRRGPPSAGRL
jgi:hypothetical protein